jgi:hypothetical protein
VNFAARSGTADTESIRLVLTSPKSYLLSFGTDKSEFEGLPAVHPCVTRDTSTSLFPDSLGYRNRSRSGQSRVLPLSRPYCR